MSTKVRHAKGEYTVELTDLATMRRSLAPSDFVVTDSNVQRALGLGEGCFVVPAGEQSKSLEWYARAVEWLVGKADRSSRIVAIGGGVVGDLAGFVAATYMRGIDLLQVPTSLLAMVDSSVGGKVGIDLEGGKNLVGSFWPPVQVLVPMDALATLPDRHLTNGAAEVWKYGAIMDVSLFESLEESPIAPGRDLSDVVTACIEHKRAVVEDDEHETTGRRAILNFGHTVGHAIESEMGYQDLLHGEAVAIGMVVESHIGETLGLTERGTAARLRRGLASQGLPTEIPSGLEKSKLVETMKRDKKALRNTLAFSLVSSIGDSRLVTDVAEEGVLSVLEGL